MYEDRLKREIKKPVEFLKPLESSLLGWGATPCQLALPLVKPKGFYIGKPKPVYHLVSIFEHGKQIVVV
jgi:hypothetical protein